MPPAVDGKPPDWLADRAAYASLLFSNPVVGLAGSSCNGRFLLGGKGGWCNGSSTVSRRAISLFTGAGGLDLGFEAAGFDVSVAVEMDVDCVATLRRNREWPVVPRSIHEISSQELLGTAALAEGEADVLIGGPPCQPFSKSGYWASGDTRRLDDPRASTLAAFFRVLRDAKPRTYLMENVAGLAYAKKDEAFRFVVQAIDGINEECGTHYSCDLLVLNAVDFGVPQLRERAFVVGSRDGGSFGTLAATHRARSSDGMDPGVLTSTEAPLQRTAWDALWDLEADGSPELRLTGKWAELLPSIPEGLNYLYHTDRGDGLPLFGWRRRFWNFLLKLGKNLPSWTITATPGPATGPFHWKNRRLSVRELCRLQTIPDDYTITGGLRIAQKQIGNAVPSALAERLAIEIRRRLLRDRGSDRMSPTLVPPRNPSVPPPELVASVPRKYRHLQGEHEAHPGTGKGNRAKERKKRSTKLPSLFD